MTVEPKYYLGIDIGGTAIKFGILDIDGNVIARCQVDTHREQGPEEACKRVADGVWRMLNGKGIAPSQIVAVGLGSAGPQHLEEKMLLEPENLGPKWYNCPICDLMKKKLFEKMTKMDDGISVNFSNDAAAAAYAECMVGKGKHICKRKITKEGKVVQTNQTVTEKERNIILLTLGTGLGCGIVLKGEIWTGSHNHGVEFGHSLIDISPTARRCGCRRPGHLEAFCSATAITKRALEEVNAGNKTTSLTDRKADLENGKARAVYEEAMGGDEVALALIDELAQYLAAGIATLIHTLDVDAIYLAGSMTFDCENSWVGKMFLQRIRAEVQKRVFRECFEATIIDFAERGGEAGWIGAALLAKG